MVVQTLIRLGRVPRELGRWGCKAMIAIIKRCAYILGGLPLFLLGLLMLATERTTMYQVAHRDYEGPISIATPISEYGLVDWLLLGVLYTNSFRLPDVSVGSVRI